MKDLYHLGLCVMCYSPLLLQILWLERATLSIHPGKVNENECLEAQQFQLGLNYVVRP